MDKTIDCNLQTLEDSFIAYFKENGIPEGEAKDIFKLLISDMNNRIAKYLLPGVTINSGNYREFLADVNNKEYTERLLNKIAKIYD